MAGRVVHPTLRGPSVVREICLGLTVAASAGILWKRYQWNEQKKTRVFYEMLDKGEISIVSSQE